MTGSFGSGLGKEVMRMSKEMYQRLRTAVYALFPDNMGRHLEVIEKELKVMAAELAADVMRECRQCGGCGEEPDHNKEPEVKKVDIE